MSGDVPNPQYCTNVCRRRFKDSMSLYYLPFFENLKKKKKRFFVFCFAQDTNLCFDTVTLKKTKLYKVSDIKRKKMAV